MGYHKSREELLSFGLSDITRELRRRRLTLHKIDSVFIPGGGSRVEWSPVWTITTGGLYKRTESRHSVNIRIKKDTSGLYMELEYQVQRDGGPERLHSARYDLVPRGSNLKPGTSRYYIRDPYSLDGGGLCTRLYLLPELGEFVPRSILDSWGVRYANQRRGHKDRYLHPRKVPSPKYRKSHYRGTITPFWKSYQDKQEEEDYRLFQDYLSRGLCAGMLDPMTERSLLEDFCRKTGRKTLPKPLDLSRIGKHSTRRR